MQHRDCAVQVRRVCGRRGVLLQEGDQRRCARVAGAHLAGGLGRIEGAHGGALAGVEALQHAVLPRHAQQAVCGTEPHLHAASAAF